jgi:hypothetical protein
MREGKRAPPTSRTLSATEGASSAIPPQVPASLRGQCTTVRAILYGNHCVGLSFRIYKPTASPDSIGLGIWITRLALGGGGVLLAAVFVVMVRQILG